MKPVIVVMAIFIMSIKAECFPATNTLPYPVKVCTYNIGDNLHWIPYAVYELSPGATRDIAAHDNGACKIKIEVIKGNQSYHFDFTSRHYDTRSTLVIDIPKRVREYKCIPDDSKCYIEKAMEKMKDQAESIQEFLNSYDGKIVIIRWENGTKRIVEQRKNLSEH
jgi:hypothetical protein